jgi:diguanylate cyclase (GGDEF)-like protein/PAS domain S-box-containing protein
MTAVLHDHMLQAGQLIWIRRYLRWSLPALALIWLTQLITYWISGSLHALIGLVVASGYLALQIWLSSPRGGGSTPATVLRLCVVLLLLTVGITFTNPEALPILVQLPLLALLIALPLLPGKRLHQFTGLVLVAECATILIHLFRPDTLPNLAIHAAVNISAILCTTVLALLLLQYQHWLTDLLEQTSVANRELAHAATELEQKVEQRTAEIRIREQRHGLLADQRRRILEVAQLILAEHSIEDINQQIGRMLKELLHFDDYGLLLVNEQQTTLAPVRDRLQAITGPRQPPFILPIDQGINGVVMASGQATLINNAQRDPRSVYFDGERPAIDHLMVLPLQIEKRVAGTINISRYRDPPFTDDDFEAAQIFGSFISLALTNAQLLGQTRESERGYRHLFEESLNVVYVSTPEGRVLDINPAGIELFGYSSREEFLALDIATDLYVDPADREAFKQQIAEQGAVATIESRRRHKNGRVIYVEESASPVRDAYGTVIAYIGFLRDITDRKRAEALVGQVTHGARCLLWAATVGELGPHAQPGDLLHWSFEIFNEAAANQHFPIQRQPDQKYADAWIASRPSEDMMLTNWTSFLSISNGRPDYCQEFRYRRADGELYWLWEEVQITPLRPGVWELVGVCTDITERKHAETQMLANQAALSRQVIDLERQSREITLINRMSQHLQVAESEAALLATAAEALWQILPDVAGMLYLRQADAALALPLHGWGATDHFPAAIAVTSCRGLVGHTPSLVCQFCQAPETCLPPHSQVWPILYQAEPIGVVLIGPLATQPTDYNFTSQTLIETAIRTIELAIANLRLRASLQHQAIRDPLTGLFNRRYMEEALERELHRMARRQSSLALIMLDLDYFKQVNDSFGHAAGDVLLRDLGQFLSAHVRMEDIACRYGGEEFLLILPDTSLADALQRAEQLCAHIRTLSFRFNQATIGRATASLGVAAFPDHGTTSERLLLEADQALFRAKASGRNQVAHAELRVP